MVRISQEELNYSFEYLDTIISTFGLSKKSIDFYIAQLGNVKGIGQIDDNTYNIIKLLVKTDDLKDIENRIDVFKDTISKLNVKAITLEEVEKLCNRSKKLKDVYQCILNIYGYITKKERDRLKKLEEDRLRKEDIVKNKVNKILNLLLSTPDLMRLKDKLEIRVRGSYDGCSYTYNYIDFNTDMSEKELEIVMRKGYYDIGYRKEYGDPCRGGTTFISLGKSILDTVVDFVREN